MDRTTRVRLSGGLVKFWREVAFKVGQARLAGMCALRSRQAIARIEQGKPTTVATAEKLVRAFNELLMADEGVRRWRSAPLALDELIEEVLAPRPIDSGAITWACDDGDLGSGPIPRIGELYEALLGGDFRAAEAQLSGDMSFELYGPTWAPLSTVRRGRVEVMEAVEGNFSYMSDQRVEFEDVITRGDSVAVSAQERGRIVETGADYELCWAAFYRFDGKKLRSTRIFTTA